MQRKIFHFVSTAAEVGIRLDQFVAVRTGELSRTTVRRIIELGGVHVGGRRVRRCSQSMQAGEKIEVHLDGLTLEPFVLSEAHILYRDKYLLAVDKPAGVETQPTLARYQGTLYAALLDYLHDPFRPHQRPPLGMVQRLDRETSGVMVFSIHPGAHRGLTTLFAGREVRKCYLAIVAGRLPAPAGEFRSHLARGRDGNRVRSVSHGGREAITRYRVLEEFADASLVEVEILTGRSHQIRVHFAEAVHPLLGDRTYGGSGAWQGRALSRQMLHARALTFTHPVSGKLLEVQAPIPDDMTLLLDELRGAMVQR